MVTKGVQFPINSKGSRSTTEVAKSIWSKAFAACSLDPSNDEILKEKLRKLDSEPNWRKNYDSHVFDLYLHHVVDTPEKTVEFCKQGIKATYEQFEFVCDEENGEAMNLQTYMDQSTSELPDTFVVETKTYKKNAPVAIEDLLFINNNDETLKSSSKSSSYHESSKREQVLDWLRMRQADGEMESDVVYAIEQLLENYQEGKQWEKELKEIYFVLLGATSELCPFQNLIDLGLNVIAIARPNKARQAKLINYVEAAANGSTLTLPIVARNQATNSVSDVEPYNNDTISNVCGADVLVDTAAIRNWLLSLYPGKRMVIGSYIYLDGGNHVRANVATDAITASTVEKREDVHVSFLASPATVYPIPVAAYEDSVKRRATQEKSSPLWYSLVGKVLGPFKPNVQPSVVATQVNLSAADQSKEIHLYNGIINVQGPNYLLAKTLQNWRCVVCREVDKRRVSMNCAPTCTTESVMHVPAVARSVKGMRSFPPLNYYEPGLARNLMSMLLLYDMSSPASTANPLVELKNPMYIISTNAVHGGLWRSPDSLPSISKAAFLYGLTK